MARPYEIAKAFATLTPDLALLATLRQKEQKEYLRKRLRAIELLWQGVARGLICTKLDIHRDSLLDWMKTLVTHGVAAGLRRLVTPKKTPRSRKLPLAAQTQLPRLLETTIPTEQGYTQFIYTARLLVDWVKDQWEVEVSDQSIYNFLHQQHFSYQRAHRDYLNADLEQQLRFVQRIYALLRCRPATERVVFFDEFSVTNRPTLFYGWARRNTRFQVPSNERQRDRLNGLLGVDAVSGALFLRLVPRARALDLVPYFHDLALDTQHQGYHTLAIILDNCCTHKDTLRYEVWQAIRAEPELQTFTLRWEDTPAYSPALNLAEYLIHQVRLQLLHHCPTTYSLADIQTRLLTLVKETVLQTPEQIKNTLNHIFGLGGLTCRI